MLGFLIRRFVPNYDQVEDPEVRVHYGMLTGCLGIALNLLLFLVKLPCGLISGSIALVSDAFNNLSDTGSSLITLIGMRMARKRPDKEHPFGHGRIEYISALLIAMMIFIVGIELFRESYRKLFETEIVSPHPIVYILLGLALLVKLWMFIYNRALGHRIHSTVLIAAGIDSLNDVYATAALLIALLIAPHTRFPVDAALGIAVSLMILFSGFKIAKDTVDLLLGGRPDPELVKKLSDMVQDSEGILGIHDLVIHDYGPGRMMASVHAEVPDSESVGLIHRQIDDAERHVLDVLDVPIVIHMDPVPIGDKRAEKIRRQVERELLAMPMTLNMHDFRVQDEADHVRLIFDLEVPIEMTVDERIQLINAVQARMIQLDPQYRCEIKTDDNLNE